MHTATVDPLVGRLLEGRYRILDRIARGGMSTVYAAVDERLDRRVAVKVMSSVLSSDPKFSDRFAREARAAARLTHVNAVAVYDQGFDASGGTRHVFLVMELVAGRTLRDLIRERGGRFSVAEAVSIMEPVLSALSAAHRAGLVHRDIKPENILLSDEGLVKVADFGLARAIDSDVASTRTGLMMGTVAYCAPEQIVHGRCDQRSDVYSAGIVLFELLTGRAPFQGDSAMNVAYQHVHSRVPAPSSRVKGIPTPIDEIVVAATDSDPTGRVADASALLAELADARAQLALPVVPIPQRPRANGAPPHARAHHSTVPPPLGTGRTDVIRDNAAYAQHDTEIVERRPAPRADAPPPPIVIPPPRTRPALSPRSRRRRRRLIAILVVLLLGALSVAGGITGVRLFREWNTHVPTVAGLQLAAAQAKLRDTGYTVSDSVTSQFSETVPKDLVIRTEPGAGTRLSQGKQITVVVSLGKDRIAVPDVTRKPLGEAEDILTQRGLTFDATAVRTQPSVTVAQGSIISTDPAPGAMVKHGQLITLVQSSGLPTVDVPHIAEGTAFEQASATLRHAKFKVTRVDDFSDKVAPGGVISLDPSDRAAYGSTIAVSVSKGPEFVTVPSFTPLQDTLDSYVPQLRALGLDVNVSQVLGGKNGRILSVDPGPGTLVHPGDTISVTVV